MNYLTQVKGFTKADARYAAHHVFLRANWKEVAVEAAQRRIDGTDGYSPTSLIEVLTLEHEFTKPDAMSAVYLHVDVDWRLEAWEAAARLLQDGGGFTKAELREQLESGGFSAVDTQYAVDKVRR